jgi:long-chain acyl-CoA synthetase
MAKEFFAAHFHPRQFGRGARFTNSLNYYLAALFFDGFPLPKREAGARETLRYIGEVVSDGFSVLIFPEGKITIDGSIDRFRPGIGMMALRLEMPIVPVRLEGLDKVLPTSARMARPGRVRVAFGPPINATSADSYESLTERVEEAVRAL